MMTFRFFFFSFSLFSFLGIYSQQKLEAVVVDADSSTPIEFVHVYEKGMTYGTIADEKGHFILNVRKEDTLRFSCVGYNSIELICSQLISVDTVFLNRSVSVLKEVIVTPDWFDAESLVKQAIDNYSKNFNTFPYESDFFYRESIQTNNTYTWFLEAFGSWLGQGYHSEHYLKKDFHYLQRHRIYYPSQLRAACIGPWKSFYWNEVRTPEIYVFVRPIRYLFPQTTNNHDYELQDVINRDGRKICIVTYTPKKKALNRLEKIRYRKERNPGFVLSSGTYYIDAETKALLQIDYEFENERNKQSSLVAFSGKYIFERINEKLFPVYALMKNEFFDDSIKYVSRHELFLSGHINLDMNVKEIETKYDVLFQRRNDVFNNPPFLSPSDFFVNINKSIKDNYGAKPLSGISQVMFSIKYDAEFWSNYSVPSNPEFDKIYKDISQYGIMENLYEKDWFQEYYDRM